MFKKNTPILALMFLPCCLFAQEAAGKATRWMDPDLNVVLLGVAILLLLPLYWSGQTLLLAAKEQTRRRANAGKDVMILLFLLGSFSASAQTAGETVAKPGVSESDVYTVILLSIIALEIFLIRMLSRQTANFFRTIPVFEEKEAGTKKIIQRVWEKINQFKPLDEEETLDTGHNYDGIRELDNITPPWFTVAFVCSILFAIGYMWRYHVSKSAPLQIEEYEIAVAMAEKEEAALLASQANKVDENTVTLLDAAGIEQGAKIFTEKCAACHAPHGGSMAGGVGPNLTDDYWLHGGSLKDIFKTIKYGWPDKGMISWKDQLSPNQIAQAASFIKSIHGSNPPGAKEPQGDLYVEEAAATPDSVTVK